MGGTATTATARALKRAMLGLGAGALMAIGAPVPALAQTSAVEIEEEIADRADDLRPFYAARGYRPLWMAANGRATPAADLLLRRIETAEFDAIEGKALRRLKTKSIRRALRRAAEGDADDIARAEVGLSELFAKYVQAARSARHTQMILETPALAPAAPTALAALQAASEADSLDKYVRQMGWMHPLYAPLRDAMEARSYTPAQRHAIWENLDRVRALPTIPTGRYVLVDTASSRLWMYEDGMPVDSMRVVVGKPETQTPMMAGFLRYAIVNPYWNVPPDLVRENIAANVLDKGLRYLKDRGYEVLSDYSAKPALVDPKTVDWQAVAAGMQMVRVRQKPGNGNFMGKVKYEFPNAQGIYLHDTPDRHLLKLDDRQLSAGCVRLEDAEKFGKWLLDKPLPKAGKKMENRVDLPKLVPIYITYLTTMPTENGIAFHNDVYGRDSGPKLARAAY